MDIRSMIFNEMIRMEISDVLKKKGRLSTAAGNIVFDVVRDQMYSDAPAYEAIKRAAGCIVANAFEFSGDVCEAATGAVGGAIDGALDTGLDTAKSAGAAASGAVSASFEIDPDLGIRVKGALDSRLHGNESVI